MAQSNTSYQNNKLKLYISATAFLSGAILLTFVFAPVVMMCIVFPFKVRYSIGRQWAISVLKWAEICCGVRYEVEGLAHIKPGDVAVVLSNHQSAWETLAFRCFLPPQTSLFKQSLLWIPFWGWAMATLKPIAIDRNSKNSALRKLISRGTEALKEGLWVVVFPEGTRMSADKMGSFSAGGAMLAQKSGFPVIPVAHNAGVYWPRYSFLKYPGTIKVKIGPYIETDGRKAAEINKDAEDWVANAMQELNR
jgi:1-acyl-sn-glycerol-3-phosphate acyltransferase